MMKPISNGSRWVAAIKVLLPLLMLVLGSCVSNGPASSGEWQSPLYRDHALSGKIWNSATGQFVTEEELMTALAGAGYLLLGEKHDNPDHHRLQAAIVTRLLQQQQVASLSFEMLTSADQARLDGIQAQRLQSLEQLREYLQWDDAGWNWDFYGPLVQAGYRARVPLLAANIDEAQMRGAYGSELPAAVSAVLNTAVTAQLNQDIDDSHCGLLPESQFPAMVRVQQSRDNAMAQAMAVYGGQAVNILIAGNYHVRRDLGVPRYLLHQQPGLAADAIVSLAFLEVQPDVVAPAAYLEQFDAVKAYDFIWFTPAISNEDYCATLRTEP